MMDTLEQMAEHIHEAWREYQVLNGRVLGPQRTTTTHPHLVPWAELDNESRNQDRFIAAIVLDRWLRSRLPEADLAETIHDAWVEWITINGRTHDHALPFGVVHEYSADEHVLQASRLRQLLRKLARP